MYLKGTLAAGVSCLGLASSAVFAQAVAGQPGPATQAPTAATQQTATTDVPPAAGGDQVAVAGKEVGVDDGQITVTARRREESLQTVPVSVQAFTAKTLQQRGVQDLKDLSSTVAGLRFGSEGGKNGVNVSLRGLSRIPLGEGIPAVVTYFADIPLAGEGSNLPTYDLANIQVLKGPQGTLFGQNSIGGAVLVTPQAPTYDFGGYIDGTYGNYDYKMVEGAVNLPIVADKVAIRFSGQVRRRNGFVENLSGGRNFDNIHQNAGRVSLLLQPTPDIRSLTVADYFKANENASGARLFQLNQGINGLSPILDPQISPQSAALRGNFFAAYSNPAIPTVANRELWGVSNNTSVDLGPLTVRNIFGYRTVKSTARIDAAGLNPIFLPGFLGPFFGKAPAAAPFELLPLDASQVIDRRYISEELQFFGSNDAKTFDWIAGGFLYDSNSAGPMGSAFRAFVTPDTPRSFTTAHVHVKSYALFAQVGYQLVPGLKLNLGGRYTWDRVRACSGSVVADRYGTRSECEAKAALDVVDGTGIIRARSDKPSWTVGLDYTVNRDVFLYAVSRRGIRGANVNTPLFESPFTTGNPTACGVPAGTGPCPDLRAVQSTGPEKITDGEIGGKFTFRAGETTARLNVAAFYQKYKNALQFANVAGAGIPTSAPDQPTNNSVAVNSADETIYGVESEFVFNPTRRLTLTLTGAWTHSQIDRVVAPPVPNLDVGRNDIVLPTPNFSGSAAVNYTVPLSFAELSLSADYFYTDNFGGSSGKNLPGYDLANARIDLRRIAGSGIDLGAFVRNLGNEKYFSSPTQFSRNFPVNTGYLGEPRTYGVSVAFRF